jgi:hypothetical protein
MTGINLPPGTNLRPGSGFVKADRHLELPSRSGPGDMCCRSGCFFHRDWFSSSDAGPPRPQGRQHGPLERVSGLGAAPPAAHPGGAVPAGPPSGTPAANPKNCDVVRLTGGGAREQLGLLQETLLQEVKARNEPVQREYERTLLTYQRELTAYEALTEEEQAAEEQPEPPEEPVLSDSFIQPVARFWKLLDNLYPERSTEPRISEFRDFQMKPGESMANMVSRLQTLKLALKQPEPASVFKFLDAIRPKTLADKVKDILRVKEMDLNSWTFQDVGDIAIRLKKAQGEETLWTTTKPAVVPSGVSGGSGFVKNTCVTCFGCGRPGHIQKPCPYKTIKSTKKAVTNARSSFANPKANRFEDRKCYLCNRPGHIARDCPQQSKSLGNRTAQLKGKPWCSYHKLNTHSSEACWALHPELRPFSSEEKVAHSARPARALGDF